MTVVLSDPERSVLTKYVELAKADPEGAWNPYFHEVMKAVGDNASVDDVVAVCSNLRKRKLLTGNGRGLNAALWPTDKGTEAVA